MSFQWAYLLWLLLAPIALLAWDLTRRRRAATISHPKILRAEAGARELQLTDFKASQTTATARPRYWLYAGLILAVVALARPQWGRIEEPVFDQSREILLALDLSRSMLAPDVKPSRLDRAKLLITSLLEKLSGERVGLVVFAGTSFLQSPLSADYEILREFLPALNPDFLPEGGSDYTALLNSSIEAFSATSSADRFLIILSDGEATDDTWRGRIAELKKKNVRVIGLGIGTAAGAMIPDNAGGLIKDERGAVVLSKLESATLEELARVTNGRYRDASAWIDLASLIKETVDSGQKGQFLDKNTVRLVERFQWPLALAFWCFLVSLCFEFPIHPRPRAIALKQNADVKMPTAKLRTAATAALFCLLFSVLCLPSSVRSADALPPPSAALSKIIGRVSAAPSASARDWAELARETVTWGSRVKSEQHAVPEGPVQDALSAVSLGSKLDAKTADWPKLREELEALLKKDDEKKDDQQQQQDKNDQQQQNQDQQQQKSDQKNQNQNQKSQQDKLEKGDSNNSNANPADNSEKKSDDEKKDGQSAFGDMKKQEQPPLQDPQPAETQKVGGNANDKEHPPEPVDPSLAIPLQKLDQIRSQDSPARLFQLMEGERKPEKKATKDW